MKCLGSLVVLAALLALPAGTASAAETIAPGVAAALKARGVFVGDGAGVLRWSDPLTRAEALKVLVAVLRGEPDGDTAQRGLPPDVSPHAWYAPYIRYGLETGLVKGYADGYFRPDATVSLAELAVLYARAARSLGGDPGQGLSPAVLEPAWAAAEIAGYPEVCDWLDITPGTPGDLSAAATRARAGLATFKALHQFGLLFDIEGSFSGFNESSDTLALAAGGGRTLTLRVSASSVTADMDGGLLGEGDLKAGDRIGVILGVQGQAAVVVREQKAGG